MTIRRFEKADAAEVSRLIKTTIQISNAKDYPAELLDALVETETEEHVLERAGWTHFYVVTDEDRIIGCGAIGPYWGKEDESSLFTIFVHPDYQGKGIGRDIIHTLERDEYFQRAQRIEIPASITGVPFYRKMGYEYKNGVTEPDEEHLIRMEKKRELWDLDTKVLGLKRGTVAVELHDPEWERVAKATIEKLRRLLSGVALDIQHIGSTAIKNIVAKPIIDIVVGVSDFDRIFKLNPVLEENGFIFRGQDVPNQYLYVCGDADSRTHHIHVVLCYSIYWNNYVNMRDYLNSHEEDAREYSELKKRLAAEYPEDRNTYTEKKSALINEILKKAAVWRKSLNHSLLKSTQNTRTLLTGSYRYIRSDVPGSLTDDEVRWLYQNGITTIVDLRSEGEFLRKPCRLEHEEGFTYHHMPVTGDGAVPDSPEEVPASYVGMIDDQMERIIHTIMNADSNVLYFCNAGKDRTGVVSAIILYRMGFDDQTIIADYMKTKENLMDLLEAYVREHPEVDHFTVIPKKENIMAVLAYLKSENTGVNS